MSGTGPRDSGGGSSAKRPRTSEGTAAFARYQPSTAAVEMFPPGEPEFEAITVAAGADHSFPGCLSAQQKTLQSLSKQGKLPGWVIVTTKGLACKTCRAAARQNITVHGAVSTAWLQPPCANKRATGAINNHEFAMSKKLLATLERAAGTPSVSAHSQRAAELQSRAQSAAQLLKGCTKQLASAAEAIHARLGAVMYLAENKSAATQFKNLAEFLNRRGGLSRGPTAGQAGPFESLTANYTSREIAGQLV